MLCLYGEDHLVIRFWAARLGLSMSDLVRVALLQFLALEEEMPRTRKQMVLFAVKRARTLQVLNLADVLNDTYQCYVMEFHNYERADYW